jgi:hypothetical protein
VSLLHPLGTAPRTQGYSLAHPAIDWGAPVGTPVRAAEGGIVVAAGADSALPFSRDRSAGGGGIIVTIAHGPEVQTLYAHLSAVAVTLGQQVSRGAPIGFSGATGTVTGPHLHFMLWINGKAVDPTPYLDGAALPAGRAVPEQPALYIPPPGELCREGYVGVPLSVRATPIFNAENGTNLQPGATICRLRDNPLTRTLGTAEDVAEFGGDVAQAVYELPGKIADALPPLLILAALLAIGVIGLKLLAKG